MGTMTSQLPSQPMRFDDAAQMSLRSDKDLFYDTAMGRDHSAMPAFYPTFNAADIRDLTAYLRALAEHKRVPLSRSRKDTTGFVRYMHEKEIRQRSKAYNEHLKDPKPAWALTPRPTPAPGGTAKP
jgi:hypothetical protein